jgi:hypothetical protein
VSVLETAGQTPKPPRPTASCRLAAQAKSTQWAKGLGLLACCFHAASRKLRYGMGSSLRLCVVRGRTTMHPRPFSRPVAMSQTFVARGTQVRGLLRCEPREGKPVQHHGRLACCSYRARIGLSGKLARSGGPGSRIRASGISPGAGSHSLSPPHVRCRTDLQAVPGPLGLTSGTANSS